MRGGDLPGARAAHRQAGQDDPLAIDLEGGEHVVERGQGGLRVVGVGGPGLPRLREDGDHREVLGMAGDRRPEADLGTLDAVVAALARAVQEQDGRQLPLAVVTLRHVDRVLPLALRPS